MTFRDHRFQEGESVIKISTDSYIVGPATVNTFDLQEKKRMSDLLQQPNKPTRAMLLAGEAIVVEEELEDDILGQVLSELIYNAMEAERVRE